MLEFAPASIPILLILKPVTGSNSGFQTLFPLQLGITCHHTMHDLAGVEDHRPTTNLTEMSGKCTVRQLDREFSVYHTPCSGNQVRLFQDVRCRQEGFNNVAGGLRVTR